jgi:hypothetical protein
MKNIGQKLTSKLTTNEVTIMQHGDCILTRIKSIPSDAKLLKGDFIVHPGNTGNNHALIGGAFEIYQKGGDKFVDVSEVSALTHNEHKPIMLMPGSYALSFVQEYDHFAQLKRAVVD